MNFQQAAKIMSLIFEPHNLTLQEINLEKARIRAEKREDDEDSSLSRFTQKIVWENTTLANSIFGRAKALERLGVRTLQRVQDTICSSGNMFFYATGCFSPADIELLGRYVEQYHFPDAGLRNNIAPVPERFFRRDGQIEIKNSVYHYLRFSFDIDITRYTYAELDLLYDVLFFGANSKIYMELSEKSGFIYSFDAGLERYLNIGNIYFWFEIDRKNILPAMQKSVDVLTQIKTSITDELFAVMPLYVEHAELDLDNCESLNWDMAYQCHIMQNSYRSIEEKKKVYQRVTPDRIMEIAREIFTLDNLVVTLRTNKRAFKVEEARAIIQKLQVL